MSADLAPNQLSIPERTLRTLSYCEPTPRHMKEWVDHLPMANLSDASRQLYHAVIELNQLMIDPEVRIKLLELLYPPVQAVCASLQKHYLNLPVILPAKARKVVRLAMAMDNHMAVGYKIVIRDLSNSDSTLLPRKAKKSATIAIHRAISTLAKTVLRSHQLYTPPPARTWHEIHQLYLIAESNKLLGNTVDNPAHQYVSKNTVGDAYRRILMLSCSKSNQMRQADIGRLYDATELWCKQVRVGAVDAKAHFLVTLGSDSPPIYKELAQKKLSPFHRGVDFSPLLSLFSARLAETNIEQGIFSKGITIPSGITSLTLKYLSNSWGNLKDRAFSRAPSNKSIKICLGFSATHYHLSGGVDFEFQMKRDHDGISISGNSPPRPDRFVARNLKNMVDDSDAWATGFDVEQSSDLSPQRRAEVIDFNTNNSAAEPANANKSNAPGGSDYGFSSAQLMNASPNGYCVIWQQEIPKDVITGQIIGVNEGTSLNWAVGVVRWINRTETDEILIGVEILAENAIPCGAKVVTKAKRKSDYMRAFLIAGNSSSNEATSLITPNLPFKEGVKVILNQYGEISHGQINNSINTTGSFSQFTYAADAERDIHDESDDNLEDVWPDI